jgi:hypothetical protein
MKENDFSKEIEKVQKKHVDTCMVLLKISVVVMALEFMFSVVCIFYFSCGFVGDCDNSLICFIHYIKFCQTLFLINTYIGNIKEKQPNHPIGTLNTFLVILLYYGCLYFKIDLLKISENCNLRDGSKNIIHFCAFYPIADFFLIFISFIAISGVKKVSNALI